MVQKLEILPINNYAEGAILKVDGVELHNVTSYTIHHCAGEIPELALTFNSNLGYQHDVYVKVNNMVDIARCMDEKQFKYFCDVWKEAHEIEVDKINKRER